MMSNSVYFIKQDAEMNMKRIAGKKNLILAKQYFTEDSGESISQINKWYF